jgi:hemoglobin-like flavoprotein
MNRGDRSSINYVVNDYQQILKIVERSHQYGPSDTEKLIAAILTAAVQIEDLRKENAKI